ncbi:hypothetical protein GGQ68_004750 [Sagittula marina]|uniref:Uncharacterized protein n=1 Tax=Sagittula marina TaxID=943940 RepID=A0A7W6DYA0_9RHOB|nr:hypothetical protein [Sagittula marina]MBB3988393.1 hypothetical protein [Sagittula marina]
MDSFERLDADIRANLSKEFVEAAESRLHWEYSSSFDIAERQGAGLVYDRPDPLNQNLLERHMRTRSSFGMSALTAAALDVGADVENMLLPNGQRKSIVRIGCFCFIAETILDLSHRPAVAAYKQRLAGTNSAIRQLEMDLGDRPVLQADWTGCHLGVLLHGCRGDAFTRTGTGLNMFRIAFPNSSYDSWVWNKDVLSSQLSDDLGWTKSPADRAPKQFDKVAVRLRPASERRETK